MASAYENARRRKQGEEAKQRVLERLSSPPTSSAPSKSIYSGVRNRSVESDKLIGTPFTKLPSLPNVFQQTQEFSEKYGSPSPTMSTPPSQLPSSIRTQIEPTVAPPQPSLGMRIQQRATERGEERSKLKGAERIASELFAPVTTALDVVSEVTRPAAPLLREAYELGVGGGLAAAPKLAAGVGTKLASAAPNLFGGSNLGQRVAREAVSEGIVGVPLSAGQALAGDSGISGRELAQQTALGAGLGAAGGAAVPLIGAGLRQLGRSSARNAGVSEHLSSRSIDSPIRDNSQQTFRSDEQELQPQQFESAPAQQQDIFTNLFGNTGVGISAVKDTRRVGKDPLTTADQIVNRSIKNDAQGIKDEAAALGRAAYQNFVDYLSPIKKLGNDAYERAQDSVRANNIATTIVRDKFVTPEGIVVGEGLENTFKKVPRGQDKAFIDYITLRHAKTRLERGERVYADSLKQTPDTVQARINYYDSRFPQFSAIAGEWDAFNDNVLKHYGVNEGLISPELYAALRERNPNYSPMYRQFSRSEKPGKKFLQKSTSSAFSGQKAPIKEVSPTGSVRNIVDPRRSTIESVSAWSNAALRNRTLQGVAQQLVRDPEAFAGMVKIVQKPKDKRDLRDIILNDGQDEFVEALNTDFKNLFSKSSLDKDNIVRVMVNGEPVHLQVEDPEIVKALLGLGPQATSLLQDTLGLFSNATKRGATGVLAPLFAVKGATMDLVQSAIQAKNPAKQATYTVYALLSGIGDKLNVPGLRNWAQEFRRAGGEYSAALKGDRAVSKSIADFKRYPVLSPQNVGRVVWNTAKFPLKALEAIGDIAENAPRIAASRIRLNELGGSRTPTNVREALSAGREATVNFSRRGTFTRDIESLAPYSNAATQGIFRVGRAIKNNPVRTTAAIGGLAVVPKLYEYFQFGDDPDYQQIPARERYRNLIVSKNDDGSFVKIPMEPAYNAVGELTIEALRKFKDDDPDAFKGAADAIANAFTPPLITGAAQGLTQGTGAEGSITGTLNATVAAPFAAVQANRSFTGAPIVSQAIEDRSPQYQYDERTTAYAKWLGDKLKFSPKKVDYLINSYGGDLARIVGPLTSDVGAGTPRNTLLKSFITDPVLTNTLSNDFYRYRDAVTRARADNADVGAEIPDWYTDDLYSLITSKKQGAPARRISELTSEKSAVNTNKSLSAQQKSERIRDIQRQINEIYLDVNTQFRDAGVPGGIR